MELHHSKHHQAYIDKLNAAVEKDPTLRDRTLLDLLTHLESIPEPLRITIRNQGGGHYNHSLFWQCMCPGGSKLSSGTLRTALEQKYGSVDTFTQQFTDAAVSLFGSGWVWLTRDLEIITLPNQDTPMALGKGEPLMGLDVWEHAYYLDYKNKRDEYIRNWWDIVNWQFVEERYRG